MKNCFHYESLTLVLLSEEKAEDINNFFGTAGNKLSTKNLKAGTLCKHDHWPQPSCRLAHLRRGKVTPCQQELLIFLHLLSPGVVFSHNLAAWSTFKTPLFGNSDAEFDKSPLTPHQPWPKAPQRRLPHQLTHMVWSEASSCPGDLGSGEAQWTL